MNSKLPYSKVTLYNQKQLFDHQTSSKALPVHNQVGYDTYSHRYFTSPSHNYPRSNYLNSPANYSNHRQGSPGSQLFYSIKDYANNLYSLHLMEFDMAENVPKRRREFQTLYNVLSFAQTNVKPTDGINLQRTNVENAISHLIQENIKLSLEQYKAKLAEILTNINRLLKLKIKYLPSATTVINYVKPNMSKRRFCDKIMPKVVAAVEELITSLSQNFQSSLATGMEINDNWRSKNITSCPKYPLTVTVNNTGNRVISVHSTPVACDSLTENKLNDCWTVVEQRKIKSNDVDMSHKSSDTRKRKCRNDTLLNRIVSSDDEIMSKKKPILLVDSVAITKKSVPSEDSEIPINVDLDATSADVGLDPTNEISHCVVHTMTEAYTQYKSYAPVDQKLPILASPPDTSSKLILNTDLSTDNKLSFILQCTETNLNSNPDYSLISFYNNEAISLPKSHLSIKFTPNVLKDEMQNIIPDENRFVFELILDENSYSKFHPHLNDFAEWAKGRNAPYIFTVPMIFADDLQQGAVVTLLHEIERPFRKEASTCLTP